MDYLRKTGTKSKKKGVLIIGAIMVVSTFFALFNLDSALPKISKDTVYIDHVKRGDMLRTVSGTGSLVAIDNRFVPTISKARVESILAQPGTLVEPDTLLMKLSNPMLSQQYDESKSRFLLAEAQLKALKEKNQNELYSYQSIVASYKMKHEIASLQMDSEKKLIENNIVSILSYKKTKLEEALYREQLDIEMKRLERLPAVHRSEVVAKEAELALLTRQVSLQKELVDALNVRAGIEGIVQEVMVEEGQGVAQGQILALVTKQNQLKAQLKVVESQAREVIIGQTVKLTTGNASFEGQVIRIDPSVINGTVTVDVALNGDLPKALRPNLRINGSIEIERIISALYIEKPIKVDALGLTKLYKVDENGVASLSSVELGRASSSFIEVIRGLNEGEQIVLSDTTSWPNSPKIQLN